MSFLIRQHWKDAIFETDISQHSKLGRTAVFSIRLAYKIVQKFQDNELHIQSTSLAYTTLLSLVPLLAVAFSVLKGFGVQNQLEPMLMQSLEPLGEKGVELGERILNFVNNLNFTVLGFTGIALLFWTVISLLQKVEEAFNTIWGVPSIRSWSRRFSDYLSVTLVGPVFMITALSLTAVVLDNETVQWVASIEPFGWIVLGLGRLMPYLLVCAAFSFVYAFLTNVHVRLTPALAGGVFASVAWYGIGRLFASFVASSSKYSAIYSGFAAAILFIIWLNVGWLIILVGAHISRYWQNPELLRRVDTNADYDEDGHREALALEVMTLIGRAYYFNQPSWTLEALAARGYGHSPEQLEDLMQSLHDKRFIVATQEDPATYVPAQAIERIFLHDITAAAGARKQAAIRLPAVQKVIDQMNTAISDSLEGHTLKELVLADNQHPEPINSRAEASS
ncbi:MAG: YihY/virulence factor BrkB family protein [Gammaproteobacteria bacterium]|jgi:membrane protein